MECPRAWLRRLRYLGPSGLLLLALFHFSSNALVFISSQRDAAEWRYLWGDAGNSRSCSVKNVLVKRQLCVFSGLLFGCTMVPGRLVHSPIVPAPTKHCLNGSMAWGPCREGQFLCLANFSDIQGKCRQLSWPAEAGKSQEWKDLDCDFVSAGQPSATQIEKIEQLSQPDFLRRSQGVAPDDVGELMLVSAAGDPGSPFDSFMMSAALTTKLMLGFVTHHIRIPDFSYYQKPLQLLNFLQRKDVSDSALVWFQDAYDTFMIHPITARNIEGLAAFDPEREVLFNGECSCHGEQTLCSDQQRLFGSRGPWHFLNSGMFLGRASVLKRFLRALSKTILGNEAHWDQAGGDQGAFMEFCFGASSNNAARLGIRCVVDSGAVLMRTMKYCDGVSSLEIPRDLGECSDQEMASRRLLCLMNCNSTNQPAGLHFNGKTQLREAEVEIVKPFILLGIQNADMARARSCVHLFGSGALYQGCAKYQDLVELEFLQVLSSRWDSAYPLTMETLAAEDDETSCKIDGRIYTCTNGPHSGVDCLRDEYSWGVCTGGKFLCHRKASTTSMSTRYRTVHRLEKAGYAPNQSQHLQMHNLGGISGAVCFRQAYKYECMQGTTTVDCLEEANHNLFCPSNELLCTDKALHLTPEPACVKKIDEAMSADVFLSHHCLGKHCMVHSLVFRNKWEYPQCQGKLCFGCKLVRMFAGCLVCDDLLSSVYLSKSNNDLPVDVLFPHQGSHLNELRVGHQAHPVQILAASSQDMVCDLAVNRTAILIYFDGWNPFHQFFVTFRSMFEALEDYRAYEMYNLGDQRTSKFDGGHLNPFDCVPVVVDRHEQDAESDLGKLILESICSSEVIVLANLAQRTACFSTLILGTSTGFDAPVNELVEQRIIHSGLRLTSRLKFSWHHVHAEAIHRKKATTDYLPVVVRRGRRELLNEVSIIRSLEAQVAKQYPHLKIAIINFDDSEHIPLRHATNIFSQGVGIIGVHGAGLTNAIFLPPISVMVEIRVGYSRAPFQQLCKQFGIAYLEFPRTFMTNAGVSWTIQDDRDRKVVVDDVTGLVKLTSFGISHIFRIRGSISNSSELVAA